MQTLEDPCYGSRVKPCSIASVAKFLPSNLSKQVNFFRNIFGRKCHELSRSRCALLLIICLLTSPGLFAQQPPPPPPTAQAAAPAAAPEPNAANPDQRLKNQRPGAPAPDEYLVDAETQEVDGDLRHLRGNVHLEAADKKLDADAVDYNDDTGEVEAWGNVRYENFLDGTKLNCDHATYNVNTESGVFYDVRGTSETTIVARPGLLTTNNPFYFEGKWGERMDGKYIIHDGFVTDCKIPKPWWRLTSTKFDIIPGQRALTYHAVFHIKKLPIFYFPAYYKSLKRLPRQSGFLTPNIGHSSVYGEMVGLAYYWAISRSYDALYRLQYFTNRGPANTLEFRGKVRPGTDFSFNLYAVEDRGINIGNGVIQKQGGEEFTFDGHSDLGDGWLARVRIDYLSSFLFREAFSQSFHDTIFSETHSVGFVIKHWSSYAFDVVADRDQEFENAIPQDTIIIKRLPQVDFLSRDRQILGGVLPVWFSLNSSAGLLDRTQPEFQTRDVVDRLDVYPELTTAFHFAGFNLTASGAIRETEYGSSLVTVPATPTSPVTYAISGQDVLRSARELDIHLIPPALERIFQSPKWLGGDKVKHVIEARVDYKLVDGINNFNNIIRFDEVDLMSDTNQVTVSLTNRLFVKDKNGNVSEAASWEVSQARYFDPTFGGAVIPGQRNVLEATEDLDGFDFLDGPRNYSPIVSVLRFQHVIGFEWRMDYDPLLGRISNSSFNGNIRLSKYFFSVGHTDVRADPVVAPAANQINVLMAVGNRNRKGWNAAVTAFYDVNKDVLDFATTEISYNTDCCGISAEYRRYNFGTRDDTQYRLSFSIANIGSFGNLRKQEQIY
ncbi:MAG: LPS-assembly protein LptD [Bryobacterales bacterium]|nr:LPS-assembly protein LptD [Bryobacterales bacterium]